MGLHANARQRFLAAAFLAVSAAGCGGGGGGAPVPQPPPPPQVVDWGAFPSAAAVIGKQGFDDGSFPDGTSPETELNFPVGSPAITSDGTLFVAAQDAAQVKAFRRYAAANGPAVAFSLGGGEVAGVSIHGQKLVIVEDNHVGIYNSVPDGETVAGPDVIVGGTLGCNARQLNKPRSALITPQGHLIVADTSNNRVLIWDPVPEGEPFGESKVVLGQRNKDVCAPNDFDGNRTTDGTRAETLNQPTSLWSDGTKLIVADRRNHRVLIWNSLPSADFQAPDHVIGQASPDAGAPNAGSDAPTASTLSNPLSVDVSDTGQMAVADRENHRVLVWNTIPTKSGQAADQVIGQADFVSGALSPASAKTFNSPSGVRFDGRNMVVVDSSNNRVLVFRAKD